MYVNRTLEFDTWYPQYTTRVLVGYLDEDWVGCNDDRNS